MTNNSINNSTKVTTYSTPGAHVWTKDSRSQTVEVHMWDAGGGGGSGRRGLSTAAGGGGGGSGGLYSYVFAPASFFGTTESVGVGIGGTGGAAQSVDTTNGNSGVAGGRSIFGNLSTETVSPAGPGGVNGSAAGLNSTLSDVSGIIGRSDSTSGSGELTNGVAAGYVGAPGTTGYNLMSATSGGGGSGADAGAERTGGNGGDLLMLDSTVIVAGGAGGVESGTINGVNGANQPTTGALMFGGCGGGGGGGQSAGAVAGTGGNGGFPGGGGGGGGGSINGTNSGAGGRGGDGLVIVVEHF